MDSYRCKVKSGTLVVSELMLERRTLEDNLYHAQRNEAQDLIVFYQGGLQALDRVLRNCYEHAGDLDE